MKIEIDINSCKQCPYHMFLSNRKDSKNGFEIYDDEDGCRLLDDYVEIYSGEQFPSNCPYKS